MHNNLRTSPMLQNAALAAVISLSGIPLAPAQEFSITHDGVEGRFNLSNDRGYDADVTIGTDARITTIENVPLSDDFGTVDFRFTLLNTADPVEDGEYRFKVGVVVDDSDSDRRLEAVLETLVLTVDGDTVTGTIPAQDLSVAGRGDSVVLDASITNSADNGPVTISGGSVTFSGEKLVERLSDNDFFTPVFDAFNTGDGTYTYSIVLEQDFETTYPAPAEIGVRTGDPLVFQSFDQTDQSSVFTLTEFTSTDGFRIQGQFTTAAADSGGDTDGDTGDDTATSPVDEETITEASTAATTFNEAVTSGDTDQARTELTNVRDSLQEIEQQRGTGSLSAGQRTAVLNTVETVFANVDSLMEGAADTEEQQGAVDDLNTIIGTMQDASVPASSTLTDRVIEVSRGSATANLEREYPDDSPEQITERLDDDPELLDETLRESLRVPALQVNSSEQNNRKEEIYEEENLATTPAREQEGDALSHSDPCTSGNSSVAAANGSTWNYVNSLLDSNPSLSVNIFGGSTVTGGIHNQVEDQISSRADDFSSRESQSCGTPLQSDEATTGQTGIQAVTTEKPSILVDRITGTNYITLGDESYAGQLTRVRAVSELVPEGTRFNSDGMAVVIRDGFLTEASPSAYDILGLSRTLALSDYTTTLRTDVNAIRVELGNGERLSGVFAYDNLAGTDFEAPCGGISFTDPEGAVNSAAHAYRVNCGINGVQQRLQPWVDHEHFFDSLEAFGLAYAVDRDTGFVTIEDTGTFKPGFFVTPPTAADEAYHEANRDALGTAYQASDVNGDGRMDYRIIAPDGVQVLYAVE